MKIPQRFFLRYCIYLYEPHRAIAMSTVAWDTTTTETDNAVRHHHRRLNQQSQKRNHGQQYLPVITIMMFLCDV